MSRQGSLPTHNGSSHGEPARPSVKQKILEWLPNQARNQLIAFVGEFVGTFLFLFFAFAGTQVANAAANNANTVTPELSGAADTSVVMYISLSFGFSLCVNAWVFFRVSGGLFNPAVTLALALIGAIRPIRAIFVFLAQVLGGIVAAAIVSGLLPSEMAVATTLGQGTSITQGLFIEMFAAFQLVFTIIMLAAEKHKSTYLAPVGIGLSLFIAELAAVPFTGGSLNPARTFGPAVVQGDFVGYHWIYWLGPALGALLAVGLYKIAKILEYETANPGQDFNEQEEAIFNAVVGGNESADTEKGLMSAELGDHGPTTKEEVMRPVIGMQSPHGGLNFASAAALQSMTSAPLAPSPLSSPVTTPLAKKQSATSMGAVPDGRQGSASSMATASPPPRASTTMT